MTGNRLFMIFVFAIVAASGRHVVAQENKKSQPRQLNIFLLEDEKSLQLLKKSKAAVVIAHAPYTGSADSTAHYFFYSAVKRAMQSKNVKYFLVTDNYYKKFIKFINGQDKPGAKIDVGSRNRGAFLILSEGKVLHVEDPNKKQSKDYMARLASLDDKISEYFGYKK